MYTTIRPKEHSQIITAWAIPGKKKIAELRQLQPYKHAGKSVITFILNRNQITIPSQTRKIMQVCVGDFLKIINFDDDFYIVKSYDGCPVLKNGNSAVIANATICNMLKKEFKAKKSIVCEVRKIKSLFNDKPMFRILIPQLYKNIYNKQRRAHDTR